MTKTNVHRRFTSVGVLRIINRLTAVELQKVLDELRGTAGPVGELLKLALKVVDIWFSRTPFRIPVGGILQQDDLDGLLRVDEVMNDLVVITSLINEERELKGFDVEGPEPLPPRKGVEDSIEQQELGIFVDPLAHRFRGLTEGQEPLSDKVVNEIIDGLIRDLEAKERNFIIDSLIQDLQAKNLRR